MCCSVYTWHYIYRCQVGGGRSVITFLLFMQLLLQGTINCRLGTLLVSGSHVQVLGGGVESLIDVNQQKRVLARAL